LTYRDRAGQPKPDSQGWLSYPYPDHKQSALQPRLTLDSGRSTVLDSEEKSQLRA
jgi:hypothetical protein